MLTQHIDLLRSAMRDVKKVKPYTIIAIVILPEHLHTIWKLPDGEADYSTRWKKIKHYFTHALRKKGVAIYKNYRGECSIWQRHYWEHTIHDDDDLSKHVNYIHYNPVKHKLVTQVSDWPFSSFHAHVKCGKLKEDWGGVMRNLFYDFGE